MWVTLTNTRCALSQVTEKERAWLHNLFTFSTTSFAGGVRSTREENLLNTAGLTFFSGLLPLLLESAKADGFSVEVVDRRSRPCRADPRVTWPWLRDYQEEAVEHAFSARRGIIHAPTSSGKTEILSALALLLPCRHLVLVHRKELLRQAWEKLTERLKEPVGRWGDKHTDTTPRVVVAMLPTVYRALMGATAKTRALLESFGALHVDEVHVLPAVSFLAAAEACSGAYYRFGYSGTPLARTDQRSVYAVAAIGPVIYRIRAEALFERGVVAIPRVRMVSTPAEPSYAAKYVEAYEEALVSSKARNAVVLRTIQTAAKPALVFVRSVEHGKVLAHRCGQAGLRAEFVWGERASAHRHAAIERVEHGHTDVLIANVIFQEGVNIPSLRSVILAGGGKSTIAAIQNVGRGMRKHDKHGRITKEEVEVFDIADTHCGCRYGSHYEHKVCGWLDAHSRARRRAYLAEGYSVEDV